MSIFQITWDCANPARMVAFWAQALGYDVEAAPEGHATWNDYWRSIGVPEHELDPDGDGSDSLVDPAGHGPRIWFQQVPEGKVGKNRLHLDVKVGGGRDVDLALRKARVRAKVDELVGLGAVVVNVLEQEGVDHYGETLRDPEGNEFCVA